MNTNLTKYLLAATCISWLFWSCRDNEKEQALAQREARVTQREGEFALKEADYQSLVRMRDSLYAKRDTVILQTWPEDIAGVWNGKSVCRESNCSEYVIGDQRNNTWEFISDSTGLYTRVTSNNNQVIRVYSASYDSTRIQLHFATDTSASRSMDLSVELARNNAGLLKGMQTTAIDKSCTAKFSIELTRSLNR